ncbi:MAG: hypothetical protein ACI8TA_003625 [Cyclobacteriaceae bacterium]
MRRFGAEIASQKDGNFNLSKLISEAIFKLKMLKYDGCILEKALLQQLDNKHLI